MTRSDDLLDRVATANPIPTEAPLTPGERHEADALLTRVLSNPPEPAAPPRPRRRRRRSLVLVGAVACAILAVTMTSVLDRGPSFTERAFATVSEPSLYHVVTTTTIDAPARLRTALEWPRGDRAAEAWFDLGRPASHVVHYSLRDGRRNVTVEATAGPDGTKVRGFDGPRTGSVLDLETGRPPEVTRFDPTAKFKEAYREGNVREEGMVTVAGRRAHRLVIEHDPQPVVDPTLVVRSSRTIALFDAQTTEPIEFIDESVFEANGRRGTLVLRTRYETFEKLPRTPGNLAKLELRKRP